MGWNYDTPHFDPIGFEAWKATHPDRARANLEQAEAQCQSAEERRRAKVARHASPTWLGMGDAIPLDPLGFVAWKEDHPEQAKANLEAAEILCRLEEAKRQAILAARRQPLWLGRKEQNK